MRHLLASSNVELLAQVAWSRVLLAFDFDGTLAPIVDDRDGAAMRDETARLFEQVCGLYPCAILSGRSRDDVAGRLGQAPVRYVVGNHGLEPGGSLEECARAVSTVRPLLARALAGCRGIDLEDKRYSLALHYRRSRHRREDRDVILTAAAALPIPLRVVSGKLVVNLLPEGAPNKGEALLHLRAEERADTALFVGDDVTDEDVFALDQPGRLLTVRVGLSRSSAARYFLRDQREVDGLLWRLVGFRKRR